MAFISNGTTVASGGSVSVSSSAIGSGTSGLSAGAVGSYMLAVMDVWAQETFGNTEAGSNLKPCNVAGTGAGGTQSGTWRCLGGTVGSTDASYNATVWLRIS